MKKLIVSVLILTFVLSCFTACSVPDFSGNKEIKYKTAGDHAVVTELPTATGLTELVIADEYEGLPVTEIADFAGCNLEYAEKITIGKSVETIGEWAFTNNQKLKCFEVNEENSSFCAVDGVLFSKDMKTLLFFPCANSKEYKMPDEVEIVRSKAFYKCEKLEKLTLSNNLQTIGEKAFFRCSLVQNIALPETLESIAKDGFGYCSSLSEITLPKTIKEVGDYAFFNCTSLLKVTVNAKESEIKFGKDWQPTNNGLAIDNLEIIYQK